MKPTLEQAIYAFALLPDVQSWADPLQARSQCGDASAAFVAFLRAFDYEAYAQALLGRPDYVVEACKAFHPLPDGAEECHVVATVLDLCIDWTARQYNPNAPFPRITTRQTLEDEGWRFAEYNAPELTDI